MQSDKRKGYIALTLTILTLTVSVGTALAFSFFSFKEVAVNRAFTKSVESKYISESGVEDGIYRIITGKQIGASESLTVGEGSTNIIVTTAGSQRIVRSEGTRDTHQQNLESRVDITTSGVNFFYGAQIGDGGLSMGNNSRVNGSVYSSGNIQGGTGAVITGDAVVSAGVPPTLDQSWTVQNQDYSVGTSSGGITTIVDSSGSVGTYTSLVLGSDGFGRISYIDTSNLDLKFARCTDAACSTSVRTGVDTAPQVDEVTSIALDSSGFASFVYYNDGNDDQRYARCTDIDCTSRNLTNIETSGNVGDTSAVKIGSDGFARIAYFQDDNGDVKFARCTNTNCTSKNVTTVDATGYVGEHMSLVLGSDGFGRISYYDDTSDDLKFARCTNTDCTTKVITVVDSTGDVGKHNSLALGADGFARISYYDDTNDDLKFVRCTDVDCTAKNITTVDSTNTVGLFTSIALGAGDLARISYYHSSSGDLKFARCTNIDCTTSVLTVVDASGTVGKYTSLALGADGFGRISYFNDSNDDLKFALCLDDNCIQGAPQIDVAQSFQPSVNNIIRSVDLYLKKVGNPANATVRLMRDVSGSPSTNPADELAIGQLLSSAVTGSYAWTTILLSSTPTLSTGTTYWILIDASLDNSNYFVWGADAPGGYAGGLAKRTVNWTVGGWVNLSADLDFKTYMGGTDTRMDDVAVNQDAKAHIMDSVTVGRDAFGHTLSNVTVGRDAFANTISPNCTITRDAAFNSATGCTISGNSTTPTVPPADQPDIPLPISDATIAAWKADAAAGGTCVSPVCDVNGNYKLDNGGTASLGPLKVPGKLELDNNSVLTLNGTIWVVGDIILSNGCSVRLSSGYGALSGVLITDGKLVISNNCAFQGSGNPASFMMILTDKNSPLEEIMTIDNNSVGVVYYAGKGRIKFSNNATAKEAVGYGITMDNGATLTYDAGLQNANFSAGPSGGYDVRYWKKVE